MIRKHIDDPYPISYSEASIELARGCMSSGALLACPTCRIRFGDFSLDVLNCQVIENRSWSRWNWPDASSRYMRPAGSPQADFGEACA